MSTLSIASHLDRAELAKITDGLVVAMAVSLPWSTTATGILVVHWLLTLAPMLDWGGGCHKLAMPVGDLPVLLFMRGVLGMACTGVPLFERLGGVESFVKLLAIPQLLVQFCRSDRGSLAVNRKLSAIVADMWIRAQRGVTALRAAPATGYANCR